MVNWRGYFFTNMYLSSIQCGIQSAHAIHSMYSKYRNSPRQIKTLNQWADYDPTMIVLNGGSSEDLWSLYQTINQTRYPKVLWTESEAALNSATTCVGIVVPDIIYKPASELRRRPFIASNKQAAIQFLTTGHYISSNNTHDVETDPDVELILLLSQNFSLAN